MSLAVQKGFWQDRILTDTRQKITSLYYTKPELFNKEKHVILGFYQEYEGLSELLGEKWESFFEWFMKATSPETITRSLRALKEDGTISLSHEKQKQRREREQEWRTFWGNEKKFKGNDGQE